jgi:iron complex transport system substrate-binding protein
MPGIVSLLPSATEIVFALGLGDRLGGRTHECDFPPEAAHVPVVTASRLVHDPLDSAGIDAQVASAVGDRGLYRLDEDALAAAAPDLILTQALCEVCAVDHDVVRDAAARLARPPRVLALEPRTLEDVLASIGDVADAAGVADRAPAVVAGLRTRLERVERAVAGRPPRRIVCLEWLDPPYAAGHWVADQVRLAGGHDPLARAGRDSVRIAPADVVRAEPDVVVLMPCGWSADEAACAVDPIAFADRYGDVPAVAAGRVAAVDGSSYFNRPGPRLVDGVELLAALLHPDAAPTPLPPDAARWLSPAALGVGVPA